MIRVKKCCAAIFSGLVLVVLCFYASAQTTLPPVVVTGTRIDGTTIICRGYDCADALRTVQLAMPLYEATIGDEVYVDGAKFCQALNAKKPANCSLTNPPASPGIAAPGRPVWQPNGCGTGGIGSWFQDFILERVAGQSYSGNLNSPYAGVSFMGACDSHDQCWGMSGNRTTCDINFRNSMNSACSQLSDSSAQGSCSGFASLYHGAVSTTDGSHGAYATSTANRACAVWANDMRENGCAN